MNEEILFENDDDVFDSVDSADVGTDDSVDVVESESDGYSDYDSSDVYDSDNYSVSASQESDEVVTQLEYINTTLSMFFFAFMCSFIIRCVHKMFFE